MVYPNHYLLQFGGSLGTNPNEIWSCGIRMVLQNAAPDDFDPGGGYLTSVAVPALAAWIARPTSRVGSSCRIRYAKCNRIAPNGNYFENDATNEYFWPAAGIAGAGPSTMPYQASVVLSWETDAAERGPASKGRIYSPLPTVQVDQPTGVFLASQALEMATSASTLLNSLDDSVGPLGQIRPHIVSNVGAGAANEINRVRVDNVVDTQRRRRNALVGASSVVPFSY